MYNVKYIGLVINVGPGFNWKISKCYLSYGNILVTGPILYDEA